MASENQHPTRVCEQPQAAPNGVALWALLTNGKPGAPKVRSISVTEPSQETREIAAIEGETWVAFVPAQPAQQPQYTHADVSAAHTEGYKLGMAQQPAPQPVTKDAIRKIFMAHGFAVKDGQADLKPYVYEAAYALLAAHGIGTAKPAQPDPCQHTGKTYTAKTGNGIPVEFCSDCHTCIHVGHTPLPDDQPAQEGGA